jgi:hypothetical protein
VWVVDTPWIEKLLSRRWTAALITGAVVIYGMFANKYASDVINEYFKVDPSHFTVTSIFLTTAYLLVGLFQPFVVLPVWLALFFLGMFVAPALLLAGTGKQRLLRFGGFALALFLISASTQSLERVIDL